MDNLPTGYLGGRLERKVKNSIEWECTKPNNITTHLPKCRKRKKWVKTKLYEGMVKVNFRGLLTLSHAILLNKMIKY